MYKRENMRAQLRFTLSPEVGQDPSWPCVLGRYHDSWRWNRTKHPYTDGPTWGVGLPSSAMLRCSKCCDTCSLADSHSDDHHVKIQTRDDKLSTDPNLQKMFPACFCANVYYIMSVLVPTVLYIQLIYPYLCSTYHNYYLPIFLNVGTGTNILFCNNLDIVFGQKSSIIFTPPPPHNGGGGVN